MGCVGCSGHKKVTTNYMKPGGFRFWSRSLLLVHLVLVLPSHAVLLLCKWSSCCTSFSWCWCCLCVGRGCCWTCLTETGSKSEQKSQAIANKIHAPFRSHSPCVVALGAFFSSFLVLPLGASSYARASSRSGESGTSRSDASRARRERTGRRPKPTRREHNASRNYRQLHTGETPDPLCPCAVDCRARRAPISSTARDFTRRPSSAGSRRRSCNARIAPGLEVPGGIFFNPLGEGTLR